MKKGLRGDPVLTLLVLNRYMGALGTKISSLTMLSTHFPTEIYP